MNKANAWAAASLLLLVAGDAQAASVTGLWQTQDERGQVQIFECGDKICGRIVTSDRLKAQPDLRDDNNSDPAQRSRLLKGLLLVRNMSGGPSVWNGGLLYRPRDGRTYGAKLKLLDANTIKVTGCVVEPLCQSQVWTRISH